MSKRKTTEQFIQDARSVHGDRYDYSCVVYTHGKAKVKIICWVHGLFEQIPTGHLAGKGCQKCACNEKLTTEQFIEKAKHLHGDKYDYSLVNYITGKGKVKIICKNHGVFEQKAESHLQRIGCAKCAGLYSPNTEEFIIKANEKHDYKYDYSLVDYTNCMSKVRIICRKHGKFSQTPNHHLKGSGCPKCTNSGFNPLHESFIYFLISEGGQYVKVGITNNLNQRIGNLTRKTPFVFDLFKYYKLDGEKCRELETYYHKKYESAALSGFDGCTEWLKYSEDLMAEITHSNKKPRIAGLI